MPKQNNVGLKVNLDTEEVVIIVWDYEEETTLAEGHFDPTSLPESISDKLLKYGLSKVLQDRTSGIGKEDKVEKLNAMHEVFATLVDGKWESERKSGPKTVAAEVEALARLKGVSVAAIQNALKGFGKESRAVMYAKPDVAEMIKVIKAERALAQIVDLSDLIEE